MTEVLLTGRVQSLVVIQSVFREEHGDEMPGPRFAREAALEVAGANVQDDALFDAIDGCLEGQVPDL